MSSEIIKVLEYLAQKLGIAVDWTSSNVMPYVEQICEKYIMWEISTSFAWMGIWAVILIAYIALFPHLRQWITNDNNLGRGDKEFLCELNVVLLIACLIISLSVIGTQIFDIIECKVFPEKAIYEYIQYILNNN